MNSEFELIRYNDNLPARIDIKQGVISTTYHWHKEFELIYVMDGEVAVKVNTNDRVLHTDEFLLLNSAENHSLSSENAKCLILDMNLSILIDTFCSNKLKRQSSSFDSIACA